MNKVMIQAETHRLLEEYAKAPTKRLKGKILELNMGLVRSIVQKCFPPQALLDDAFQEGCVAFCSSIDRYDISRNTRFSAYAGLCVRHAVVKWLQTNISPVHIPVYIGYESQKSVSKKKELEAEYGRQPTDDELCKALGIKPQTLALQRYADKLKRPVRSLDSEGSWDFPEETNGSVLEEDLEELESVLVNLTPIERALLYDRYVKGHSYVTLAQNRNLKQGVVKRTLGIALQKAQQEAWAMGACQRDAQFKAEMSLLYGQTHPV